MSGRDTCGLRELAKAWERYHPEIKRIKSFKSSAPESSLRMTVRETVKRFVIREALQKFFEAAAEDTFATYLRGGCQIDDLVYPNRPIAQAKLERHGSGRCDERPPLVSTGN
jgi:hypothetical protein